MNKNFLEKGGVGHGIGGSLGKILMKSIIIFFLISFSFAEDVGGS